MNNQHLVQPILATHLPPMNEETAVLALHGRGGDPSSMLEISGRLGWDSLTWICPAAENSTWYPNKFMDPVEKNEPWLSHALDLVHHRKQFLNGLGFSDDRIIILGFSQGACLAAEFAYRYPARYRALVSFTGGLIGEMGTTWDIAGDFGKTPVFITTSKNDEWVPPTRVDESADVFGSMNADVHKIIYDFREHEVSDDEIEQLNQFLVLNI
jgi:phospholipase/carboxylesterase